MRICIYGTQAERQMLVSAIDESQALAFRQYEADSYENYDALICAVKENTYDLIIIMKDNADGMEGVIAVKSLFPNKPVIWFSNDRGFGAQSYRLGCEYFSEKRFIGEKLETALSCCSFAVV